MLGCGNEFRSRFMHLYPARGSVPCAGNRKTMNMKTNITWFIIIAVVVVAQGGCASGERHAHKPSSASGTQSAAQTPTASSNSKPVPAHLATEPSRISLAATLEPEQFTGKTREAYRVVREVPQLIAQLPCYCYCDRGFGHKSLHSCYVDDHAAHCAVCVDEVLIAYDLQKRGMSASQIREQIITQFGG